jgi:hypothetical protein
MHSSQPGSLCTFSTYLGQGGGGEGWSIVMLASIKHFRFFPKCQPRGEANFEKIIFSQKVILYGSLSSSNDHSQKIFAWSAFKKPRAV